MISVLCVDDEPDLRELAQLFLEQSGDIRVVCFDSAEKALNSPDITSCDIIVSDYQMPGMDGIALLKEVRKRFGDTPFILFTGRGREEIVIEAINNGADFYVQKGGDPASQFAELLHKIRQAVRRHRAETSLHDSRLRMANIIDFLPDAMIAIDRTGCVIAWNRAMEELTGIAAADILGKGEYGYALPFYREERPLLLDLIFAPEEKVRQNYTRIVRNGTTLTAETDHAAPKGNRVSLLVKAGPLYNRDGEITGAIEVLRDITEIKKTELELRAAYEQVTTAEEKLRSQYNELMQINEQLSVTEEELTCQVDKMTQSEHILRTNEERLAMAQAIGQTGSWEYRIGPATIWGSAEGLRIFGYPAAARDLPIGEIESCILEKERVHQALLDLVSSGKPYDLEYTIHPADGSAPRVIHSVARLERDAGGDPVRVIGVIQDVTERRHTEAALHESAERYRLMMMNAKDGIIVNEFTPRGPGKFMEMNDPACRILGMTREELQEISLADLDTPEMKQKAPELVASLKKDRYAAFPVLYRMKTGEEKHLDIRVSIFDVNGQPTMLSIVRDVTGQMATEKALCESESRFRTLVETLPDIIWETDLQGRFRYISPMMETIMGYKPEEIAGNEFQVLIAEQKKAFARRQLEEHLSADGPLAPFEIPARHRDGHEMFVEIRASRATDGDGKLTGFRGVTTDVTRRMKSEEALRRANRQLTLLGSVTRHDVLNRITVLMGFLAMAKKKCTDPAQAVYLQKVEAAIDALKVQMEFMRIYQTIGSHEPRWIDLASVMPRAQVPETISLVTDVGEFRVFADVMFEKVFGNLLDNSIRHGGNVTEIRVDCRTEGADLVITWEDNGVGVGAGRKEQIFCQGVGSNTGLGLFLIREILSLTGISIRETGEPGKGARFEIMVPEGSYLPARTA